MFSAAELADLQTMWAASLDDTATILRPTQTVDSSGGRSLAWGTVTQGTATSVAGRWQPNRLRSTEAPVASGGLVWAVGPMLIMLPAGTDVAPTDRVRRESDSSLWEVRGEDTQRSYQYGVQVEAAAVTA